MQRRVVGLSPSELIGAITTAYMASSSRDGYDLLCALPHGWSEAQTNAPLGDLSRTAYLALRHRLAAVAEVWQAEGSIDASADPDDVGQMLTSLALGFVLQHALTKQADPATHQRGSPPSPIRPPRTEQASVTAGTPAAERRRHNQPSRLPTTAWPATWRSVRSRPECSIGRRLTDAE